MWVADEWGADECEAERYGYLAAQGGLKSDDPEFDGGEIAEWYGYLAAQGGFKSEGPEFHGAKIAGWGNLKRREVFEWARDEGREIQRTRWILTKKQTTSEKLS